MPNLKYSKQMRTYLRRIYIKTVEENDEITSGELAMMAGVKMPTAVEVVKKLEKMELIYRKPWGPIKLTEKGIKVAESIIFRHRIIETYLSKFFELDHKIACCQASLMEEIDDTVVYVMCSKLGHPCKCVHGRKIPHFSHEGERV